MQLAHIKPADYVQLHDSSAACGRKKTDTSAQAHEHAHELYRCSPRWCLDWRFRKTRLLAEIAHWQPDIGCLQEVDQLLTFQAQLAALGCVRKPPHFKPKCQGTLALARPERGAQRRFAHLQAKKGPGFGPLQKRRRSQARALDLLM